MTRKPKINYSAQKYLPTTSDAAAKTPNASLGIDALTEALCGGANLAARVAMANLIAKVGFKYTPEARAMAAEIASGARPMTEIPPYMIAAA